MIKYIIILVLLFSSLNAINWYVRENGGSYGSENGADWTNAFDGWSDIAWGNISPGDTIFAAGGEYTQQLSPQKSGTSGNYIVIFKATASTHGTGTGWQSIFGIERLIMDGNQYWAVELLEVDYFELNGGDQTFPYGWKIKAQNADNAKCICPGWSEDGSIALHLYYLELEGAGANVVNETTGVYTTPTQQDGNDNHHYKHLYIHNVSTAIKLHSTDDTIIEYITWRDINNGGGSHPNLIWAQNCDNVTVRYSTATRYASEGIFMRADNSNWYIYGNALKADWPSSLGTYGIATKVGDWTNSGIYIYHNTISDCRNGIAMKGSTSGDAKNNICYDNYSVGWGGLSHSYNAYDAANGDEGEGTAITDIVSGTFADYANFNLRLIDSTLAGTALSATYNTDMDGQGRDSWDRGAFEYEGGSVTPPPPIDTTGGDGINWYIDVAASGANNGTDTDDAWEELDQIDWQVIDPGDSLHIKTGSYSTGLTIGRSGSDGNNIVILPKDGDVTITNTSGMGINNNSQSFIVINGERSEDQGIRITNCGTHGWWSGTGNIEDVELRYLQFDNNGDAADEHGIQIRGYAVDGVLISHCDIYDNYQDGINIYSSVANPTKYDHIIIEHTEIYTTGANVMDDGIQAGGYGGITIRYCTIHDLVGDGERHSDGIQMHWELNYISIHHNLFYETGNTGCIFLDPISAGTHQKIRIFNNIMFGVDTSAYPSQRGIQLYSDGTSGTWNFDDIIVANNIIVDMGYYGIWFREKSGSTANLTNAIIANNIIYNNQVYWGATNVIAIEHNYTVGADNVFLYNNLIYAGAGGTDGVKFNGTSYTDSTTLNAVTDASGNIFAQPTFTTYSEFGGAGNNLKITTASEGVDVGYDMSSYFTIDFDNVTFETWDIGAYSVEGTAVDTTAPTVNVDLTNPVSKNLRLQIYNGSIDIDSIKVYSDTSTNPDGDEANILKTLLTNADWDTTFEGTDGSWNYFDVYARDDSSNTSVVHDSIYIDAIIPEANAAWMVPKKVQLDTLKD